MKRTALLLSLLVSLAGCPSDPVVVDSGVDAPVSDAPVSDAPVAVDAGADAPTPVDAPVAMDAPLVVDAPPDAPLPPGFMVLPNCPTPAAYVTAGASPAVTIAGFTYTPPCLIVNVGATVAMPGEPIHPLIASTMGSSGNPIPTNAMTPSSVMFPTAGFFPYYCGNHGSEAGGMAGVIQVVAP
jgi:plastocyanin